jgi:hypothetical protein
MLLRVAGARAEEPVEVGAGVVRGLRLNHIRLHLSTPNMDMGFNEINFRGRVLSLRKANVTPDFRADTVLVSDPWDYVDLWLKREGKEDARDYWEQACEFAKAADALPPTSAPLLAYYCMMNATKALLEVRNEATKDAHGVHGDQEKARTSLDSEKVHFHADGVLGGLCRLMKESSNPQEISLKDALYNLPYVHRAFCLTYTTAKVLFIPIKNPRFVQKPNSNESWFCATVEERFFNKAFEKQLPPHWEFDQGADMGTIRYKKRFDWVGKRKTTTNDIDNFVSYHGKIRKDVFYIHGSQRLWYLKCNTSHSDYIGRSSLTLTFAAMHRLSELSRYDPLSLRKHLERKHNWLLSEFISIATKQFIDEIASEMTGSDFLVPGLRK